jgi:hypothetical protein
MSSNNGGLFASFKVNVDQTWNLDSEQNFFVRQKKRALLTQKFPVELTEQIAFAACWKSWENMTFR